MKFVEFTAPDGDGMLINLDQVVLVEPSLDKEATHIHLRGNVGPARVRNNYAEVRDIILNGFSEKG